MRREHIPADEAFFAERRAGRARGARRSRERAAAFAAELGLNLTELRTRAADVIIVVGSKGKGTAATYASATLAAAGLRVGTLTSPGLVSNRERIRVDGRAIDRGNYESLVGRVVARLAEVAERLPDDGYLSPTGLFTLAGLRHLIDERCDVLVLEAGMGGASDEVSLLEAGAVVITAVFAEHLGVLGNSVAEIAAEKLGVVTAATHDIVLVAGSEPSVLAAAHQRAATTGAVLHVVDGTSAWPLPPGLAGANAAAGIEAAQRLLERRGATRLTDGSEAVHRALDQRDRVLPTDLATTLATVRLPGRLSEHVHGGEPWLVDCAANPAAVSAAVERCRERFGEPAIVLLCIPADKDRAGVEAILGGLPVQRVRVDAPHLDFSGWEAAPLLDGIDTTQLRGPVLAVGTIYFAGAILAMLGTDCTTSFTSATRVAR